jgi:hypothetical protein
MPRGRNNLDVAMRRMTRKVRTAASDRSVFSMADACVDSGGDVLPECDVRVDSVSVPICPSEVFMCLTFLRSLLFKLEAYTT